MGTAQAGTFRSAWQHRKWRWLFGSIAVSGAGDWLYVIALVVFIVDTTGSAGWVAVASVTRMLAYVFLSPIGGALADRYDRRRLMITLDVARGVLMVLLAVTAWADGPVVLAVALATLSSVASTPYRPSATAATTELVGEQDLAAANAAESIVFQIASFLGPALGAALVAFSDAGWAFLLNGVTFFVGALLVLRIGNVGGGRRDGVVAADGDDAAPGMVAEILDGARVLKADRALIALIVIGMASSFVFGFEQVVHVLVADEQLDIGTSGVGVLAAAVGLGGMLIAPFTPRLGASKSIATILVLAAAMQGVPTILLSVIHSPVVASVVLFVEGAAVIVQEVLYITLLQRAVLGDKLGRILGLQDSLSASGQMLGSIAVPVLVALVDLDWTLVVGGAAVVASCLAAGPGVRRLADRTEADRQRLAPLVEELRATGILGEATQAALERIARSSDVVEVPAGATVFLEGEVADRLYVVRRGTFAVERDGEVVAELGPAAWFGEVGLVHKRPRNATVRSVDGGEVIAVPGAVFLGAVEQAEVLPDPLHRSLLARSVTAIDVTDGA